MNNNEQFFLEMRDDVNDTDFYPLFSNVSIYSDLTCQSILTANPWPSGSEENYLILMYDKVRVVASR